MDLPLPLILLIKASVLFLAAIAVAAMLRRAPVARHRFWSGAFAAVLLLPLMAMALPGIEVPGWVGVDTSIGTDARIGADARIGTDAHIGGTSIRTDAPIGVDAGIGAGAPIGADARIGADVRIGRTASIPLTTWLLTIWAVGVGAATFSVALSLVRTRRLARTARAITDPEWLTSAADLATRVGLRTPARVLEHNDLHTPMAGGVWRPTVFLPASAREWSAEQRDIVLTHELVHLAGRDPLRHVMARLTLAIYWFHPLAWLAGIRAAAAREAACDEAVVALGVRRSSYARVLVALAESAETRFASAAALPVVQRSNLERRVMTILNNGTRPAARGVVLTTAIVSVALTLSVAAARPTGTTGKSGTSGTKNELTLVDFDQQEMASASSFLVPALASQGRSAPEAGSIVGRVVDGDSGTPVEDVSVTATRNGDRTPTGSARTTATGQFSIKDLAPGVYVVMSSPIGEYVIGLPGQRFADDGLFQLQEVKAGAPTTIAIKVWRYGAITGRVLDADGSPVVGATVQALDGRVRAGEAKTFAPRATTDDRGQYRLEKLTPGDYVVFLPATAPTGPLRSAGYPPMFYPDATHLSLAQVLSLRGGDELTNIDLRRAAVKTFRLSGQVANLPPSGPPVRLEIVEVQPNGATFDLSAHSVVADVQGRFRFDAVVAGSYVLRTLTYPDFLEVEGTVRRTSKFPNIIGLQRIIAPLGDGDTLWNETPIDVVDKDIDNVVVSVQSGARFAGRVVFEGSPEKPLPVTLMSTALAVGRADGKPLGNFPMGRIEATGEFRTVQFPPGKYTIALPSLSQFPNWHLASVKVAGRDTLGHGIELGSKDVDVTVTFTERPRPQLSGTVVDRASKSRPDAWVMIFPVDVASWATMAEHTTTPVLQRHLPTQLGTYSATLPPGEYYVAGVLSPVPPNWKTPEFLAQLVGRAIRVTVVPGDRKSVDVVAR